MTRGHPGTAARHARALITGAVVCALLAALGGFLAVGHGGGRPAGLWLGMVGLLGCGWFGFRLGPARRIRRAGGAADTHGRP
jgi:hypothetical protein